VERQLDLEMRIERVRAVNADSKAEAFNYHHRLYDAFSFAAVAVGALLNATPSGIETAYYMIITSDKKVLCLSVFSVCLFVGPLATSRKTTDRIFAKILQGMHLWTRKNRLNSGSRRLLDSDLGIF